MADIPFVSAILEPNPQKLRQLLNDFFDSLKTNCLERVEPNPNNFEVFDPRKQLRPFQYESQSKIILPPLPTHVSYVLFTFDFSSTRFSNYAIYNY